MQEEERRLGRHMRVVDREPQLLKGKSRWLIIVCLDCGLESESENEFQDKPCNNPAKKG